MALIPFFALAACGSNAGTATDASVTDVSSSTSQVAAICAAARAGGCTTNASCETDVLALYNGVPSRCATPRGAFFACAAASRGTTCAMFADGHFAGCAAQESALDACVSTDASTEPGDATAVDSGPSVPAPSAWLGAPATVSLTLEGAGFTTPQGGEGTASLGIGPTGSPAGAYILNVASTSFLGGASFDCRVGLLYSDASRAYTFSSNSLLTAPCQVTLDGMTTTLTFTGATVQQAPAGNVFVRVNVTGAGPLATGAGVLQVTWPAP